MSRPGGPGAAPRRNLEGLWEAAGCRSQVSKCFKCNQESVGASQITASAFSL